MKKIVISPDTFIWIQGDDILLYNSYNFSHLLKKKASGEELSLCRELLVPTNLYCFEFDEYHETINKFVDEIVEAGLGRKVGCDERIITFPPVLSIQNNLSRIKSNSNIEISHFLHSFSIYTGGTDICNDYGSQTLYPIYSEISLAVKDIYEFIDMHMVDTVSKVRILLSHNDAGYVKDLIEALKGFGDLIEFHLEYSGDIHRIVSIIEQNSLRSVIYITPDSHSIADLVTFIRGCKKDLTQIKTIVSSEADCSFAEILSKYTGEDSIGLVPVFKDNLSFFEKNILLSEADILKSRQNRRQVFIHQCINIYEWGELSLMPDRTVRTAPDSTVLGQADDSIYDLIVNALDCGDWLKTRNEGECADCLYRLLCPSISRFEKMLPRRTACNFK